MDNRKQFHGSNLRKGRVSMPGQVYIVTACTARRQPLFADFTCGCAAATHFARICDNHQARLITWVLMPDHVHWVVQLRWGSSLSRLVQVLKSVSAQAVNRRLQRKGRIWQAGFHDRAVRAEQDLRVVCRYVVANPLRAGLVADVRRYPFWDAVWL